MKRKNNFKKELKQGLSIAFCIFFILMGLAVIEDSLISSILIILSGVILLPNTTNFIKKRFCVDLSGGKKILSFVILLFIAIIISEPTSDTKVSGSKKNTLETQQEIEIISDNLAQFVSKFWSYTDLQRKEKWKEYKGEYVKWTFYVRSVDTDMFGTYTVLGDATKPDMFDFGSDVTVKFPESEKELLLSYSEGDLMTIVGILNYYSDSFANTISVKPAKIVSTEVVKYADSGKNSKDCQEIRSMCDLGDGNSCLALTKLKKENLC